MFVVDLKTANRDRSLNQPPLPSTTTQETGKASPTRSLLLQPQLPPLQSKKRNPNTESKKAIVEGIGKVFSDSSLLKLGLQTRYSPNHTLTTAGHKIRQNKMLAAAVQSDYVGLAAMVKHASEKLRTTPEKIQNTIEPLLKKMTADDLRILAVIVGIHDLGKVDAQWAKNAGLDLAGSDFIAHDYETEVLLEANPDLLRNFVLSPNEDLFVKKLSKLHSLPGQYFFGEGHLAAYQELCEIPGFSPERALRIARLHGVLDVMSALNENFVHFILDSHVQLRDAIDEVLQHKGTLAEKFEQLALENLDPEARKIGQSFGLGTVATYRLCKLAGLKGSCAEQLEEALQDLDPSFLRAFDEHSNRDHTWYGTYIANAFGSGLAKQLATKEVGLSMSEATIEALRAVVKMVAIGAEYRSRFVRYDEKGSFAFSANKPSLIVAEGGEQAKAVWLSIQDLKSVHDGLKKMSSGQSRLTLRGNHYATDIGWLGERSLKTSDEIPSPNPIDGVRRALAGQNSDFRFYHLVNHLLEAGFDPKSRSARNAIAPRYLKAFAACHDALGQAMHPDGLGEKLGEGLKGEVFRLEKGQVCKFAKTPIHCAFNEIEAAVAQDLTARFSTYNIRVVPITDRGPSGAYLSKKWVSMETLGGRILESQNGTLRSDQHQALQELFEAAKRYAKDTGISLNLTSDNLIWVKDREVQWSDRDAGHWAVLDCGPRTSTGMRKFRYTTDCENFSQYLNLWNKNYAEKRRP